MTLCSRTLLLSGWVLLAAAPWIGTASADEGSSPYLYCTTCHGADGNGNSRIGAPKISGMEGWYIRNQFRSFLSGWRGEHVADDGGAEMRAIARILMVPEDLDQVIDYVSRMNPISSTVTVAGDIDRGGDLYRTCAACHGPEALGQEALNAPALAGQSDWYLLKSLNDYRQGIRGAHPGDVYGLQMKATVSLLRDDEAVRDVVAYIGSLEPGKGSAADN
jgi:cytochrome c oxidase subunit 2